MEEKYYTPEISEFHVGFEYETLVNNNWIKSKINDWYESIEAECRVKYLDAKDIESCGWENDQTNSIDHIRAFKKDKYFMTLNTSSTHCVVFYFNIGQQNVFYGEIKNKSEFKKLMQQLGIK